MFTKLFVAESTGALGNVQNHTRCSALPLVAETAALVVGQLRDQRLGDEGESTSMLPCNEFLEVSHTPRWVAQCDNQHRLFAGGSLFLRRGACHLEPLRRLRNFATTLVAGSFRLEARRRSAQLRNYSGGWELQARGASAEPPEARSLARARE